MQNTFLQYYQQAGAYNASHEIACVANILTLRVIANQTILQVVE